MHVGMVGERLPPGMQDGDEAEAGLQALRGEHGERLGRRAHQQTVDERLVLKRDLGRRRRQREHDVEIGDRQKLGFAIRQPLRPRRALAFWTSAMPAGVVRDARQPAIVAALDMTAERRCPASGDSRQHAPFAAPEMESVLSDVSLAVSADDVGEFERRRWPHRLLRRRLQRKPIQGARRSGDEARRDAGVARRRRKLFVSQQNLDDADIGPAFQKMRGEAVTQGVHRHPFVQA
jgi:hypothetical protein